MPNEYDPLFSERSACAYLDEGRTQFRARNIPHDVQLGPRGKRWRLSTLERVIAESNGRVAPERLSPDRARKLAAASVVKRRAKRPVAAPAPHRKGGQP